MPMLRKLPHQPGWVPRLDRANPLAVSISTAVVLGGTQRYDAATNRNSDVVGTAVVARTEGVAAGFGTTFGVSTSDRITAPLALAAGAAITDRSYYFRAMRNGAGGSGVGRLLEKTNGTNGQLIYIDNAAGTIKASQYFGGVEISHTATAPALGEWFDLVVTQSTTSTTLATKIYVDGVLVTDTSSTPGGTLNDTNPQPITIGNRSSGIRGFDGLIEYAVIWERILSDGEALSVSNNPRQLFAASARRMLIDPGPITTDATCTTSQAQAVAAVATTSVDAVVASAQGQSATGGLSDGSAVVTTSQGQSTAAIASISTTATASTSQAQSVSGEVSVATVGDVTLPVLTMSGAAVQETITTGNSIFPELEMDAASLEPAMALNQLTVWATGIAGTIASGSITFTTPSVGGGIDDGSILEELTVSGAAFESAIIEGDILLEALECAGSLEPAMALEELTLDATALNGDVATGDIVMPELDVVAFEGTVADLVFEAVEVDATGLNGNVANGDAEFAKLTVGATHFQNTTASGDITLALYSVDGAAGEVSLINGSVTISALALDAVAVAGTVSSGLITIPLIEVDAAGYFNTVGTATIELPLFSLDSRMNQSGVAAVYTTVALNTQIRAVSLYEGVAFNSFANFAGFTLAASTDGIVALVGDTDLGVNIDALVASGVTDFGMREIKQVLTGYVGYRAGGNLEVTMVTDQHHEYSYVLHPRQDAADLHASRVKFGRGVKGRYWQWKLANRNGAAFDIDMLSLEVSPSVRRI